ncbi:MAG TPA: ABC transporter permease [Candidatus Dormibacteraeota bacterium]|nr:ABC transporter permease [Candidatus Dormibacteraeota bacterium]
MFWIYLTRELRRRRRQAAVVALSMALGIGLVVTTTSMSSGIAKAQAQVLHSLYGVGTDVTVTQAATVGSGGPQRFGFGFGGDRAKRPKPGQKISQDRVISSPGQGTLAAAEVAKLAALPKVSAATGGLTLNVIHISGTIPQFSTSPGSGGFPGGGSGGPGSVGGPTSINVTSYSMEGVEVTARGVGPLTAASITSGRFFAPSETNAAVAILAQSFAKQQRLHLGSTTTIDGTSYRVIGLAAVASGSASVYLPLARAQVIAGLAGKVSTVYVKATSAANISTVTAEIQAALPKATITSASDLASQVSGSLSSAATLAGVLGKWLSIAVLLAAFALASLLTLSAVSRRVRELGTLKALGWRSRRIVGQVMGEALVLGVIGGILGTAVGIAGAVAVSRLIPNLTASLAPTGFTPGPFGGGGGPPGGGAAPFRRAFGPTAHVVTVHLSAPLSASTIVLAIVLAIAGGLIAGTLGGWRAARLRPAEAMRRVE